MNGEGEVLYGTVDQDSSCPVSTNHYAAGPLYDIKCVRGELSQLQLPHCEMSPGEIIITVLFFEFTFHFHIFASQIKVASLNCIVD